MSEVKIPTIASRVENMCARAYDMFPQKHEESKLTENPFPMYSYERAGCVFWSGFIEELMERGLRDEDVEALLQSKQMRWMFDEHSQKLADFAKTLVTGELIVAATRLSE